MVFEARDKLAVSRKARCRQRRRGSNPAESAGKGTGSEKDLGLGGKVTRENKRRDWILKGEPPKRAQRIDVARPKTRKKPLKCGATCANCEGGGQKLGRRNATNKWNGAALRRMTRQLGPPGRTLGVETRCGRALGGRENAKIQRRKCRHGGSGAIEKSGATSKEMRKREGKPYGRGSETGRERT